VLVHEERPPPPTPRERAFERQALRHIQASLEKWQDVNAADVRALPRAQLERLCEVDGDDYLWRMAQAEAQRRARDRDDGGGRER
jgi:acetoin utilization deacetylase AcuC-like enzyme